MDNAGELVEIYLAIRKKRETLKAEFDSADRALKDDLEKIEAALLSICNQTNTDGLKTAHGTVSRQVKDRYTCSDWDNFKKFVETEGSIDLLERRIHQTNFKQFMTERAGDGLPPGVNVMREYAITVYKPRASSNFSVEV
jgi:hypothetical protein